MRIGYLMQQGVEIRKPPFNGPANHVREFIGEFERRGHQFRVLLHLDGRLWRTDDLTDFQPVVVKKVDRGLRRILERGVRRIQSTLQLPYAAYFESRRFALACLQELSDCDLLYERASWVGYGGGLAASLMNIPLVLEDNGDQLTDLEAKGIAPRGAQRWISVSLMRRGVHRAAHVISTGDGWRHKFIDRWAYDPAKITTVENGTNLVDLIDRKEIRAFGDPVAGRPMELVYLGGFYPWHGVPVLLKAFAAAHRENPHCSLTLIGAGDGFAEARQLAGSLGLEDQVTFTGPLRDLEFAPILAGADIGLSPYCGWPEFSGLKIFDYKAAGMATITTGLDGLPKSVVPGENGLIVPPCEEKPLTEAILNLVNSPDTARTMGQTARKQAENCHRWEHTADKIEAILRPLV